MAGWQAVRTRRRSAVILDLLARKVWSAWRPAASGRLLSATNVSFLNAERAWMRLGCPTAFCKLRTAAEVRCRGPALTRFAALPT